ncbi:MAG: Asp-tRNA(Asn)/Glu-tRNA(Gln) amidotransferase subunit GatC [Alphaproteobacteria bacterium]|nr:Asp-tRNA(Asn)/Glu-tRNA(Gln) amidotransferase subunit GatC [Alphaproteobacteria bacterium]
MELTRENILRVAKLARLNVPEDRIEPLRQNLNHIMEWIETLDEVDVTGVEPMFSVNLTEMRRRADKVTDGGIAKDIVANAPGGGQYNMFSVPKVVE